MAAFGTGGPSFSFSIEVEEEAKNCRSFTLTKYIDI